MRWIIFTITGLLLVTANLEAGQKFNIYTGKFDFCATIQEEDGSPVDYACSDILVSNDSLTDNGDGTFSLSTATTETDPTLTDDNAVTIGSGSGDTKLTFDGGGTFDPYIEQISTNNQWRFVIDDTQGIPTAIGNDDWVFIDTEATNSNAVLSLIGGSSGGRSTIRFGNDSDALEGYIEYLDRVGEDELSFFSDDQNLPFFKGRNDGVVISDGNTDIGPSPTAQLDVRSGDASRVVLNLQHETSSTADSIKIEQDDGTDIFRIDVNGTIPLSGYDCSGNANGGALTADASGNITCTDDDSGSTSPGGADTQIQYNESGAFGAEAAFVWDRTNDELELGASGTDTTILFNDDTATSPGIYWDEDVNEILAKVWGTDDAGSANHGFRIVSEKASSSAYFTVEAVTADRSIMLVGDNGNTHHLQTTGTDAPGFMFVVGSNQILPTEGPATHNTTATLQDGTISFGRDANRWDIYADLIDSDTTVDFGEALVEINNQADCSGRTAEGAICWDSDNDVLYVGDGVAAASIGGSETNALESDGASGIADTEIFIGTGAGTGNYAAVSGDATLANTGALTIASDAIEESMLKAVNSPTDEYVLTYETTTGDFEWQAQTGGASTFNYTFNADQAKLPSSNPCIIYNPSASVTSYLLCDDSTDESATWSTTLAPFNAGTITAQVYYSMVSATSGNVDIEVSIMCVSDADAADIDTESFATAGAANATVPGTAGYMDVLTITPTDDSCAANDLLVVKVNRDANDATNDTATGDVEIRKVRLYEA